jgi:hypothetical protein
MKGTHQGSLYYNSRRFGEVHNRKHYSSVRSVAEMLWLVVADRKSVIFWNVTGHWDGSRDPRMMGVIPNTCLQVSCWTVRIVTGTKERNAKSVLIRRMYKLKIKKDYHLQWHSKTVVEQLYMTLQILLFTPYRWSSAYQWKCTF